MKKGWFKAHLQNTYNSFVPNQMHGQMQHGHHDGHDSDGSGEYDRLGYESHQVGRQQLPPHQQ